MLRNAGAVHQYVQRAQPVDGGFHHGDNLGFAGYVAANAHRFPAECGHLGAYPLGAGEIHVCDGYIAAIFRKAKRDNFAKACCGTGDQRGLAGQIE